MNQVKNLLTRFIDRNVADIEKSFPVSFKIEDFEILLNINSNNDFEVLKYIWKNYGECSFKNGLFWTINPNDYKDIVKLFSGVSDNAIPIIKTATGNFLIWDLFEDEYVITYLDIHFNEYKFYGDTFADLFNYDLISDAVWIDELNGKRERIALNTFPHINSEESIVPIPTVAEGGDFESKLLKKVKTTEYLPLLSIKNKENRQ